jgi:hypothetical protein
MNTTCMNSAIFDVDDRGDEPISHESTYAMLVREEERERTALETLLYFLVVVSAIAAIWQFARQPIDLPLDSVTTIADAAPANVQPALSQKETRG